MVTVLRVWARRGIGWRDSSFCQLHIKPANSSRVDIGEPVSTNRRHINAYSASAIIFPDNKSSFASRWMRKHQISLIHAACFACNLDDMVHGSDNSFLRWAATYASERDHVRERLSGRIVDATVRTIQVRAFVREATVHGTSHMCDGFYGSEIDVNVATAIKRNRGQKRISQIYQSSREGVSGREGERSHRIFFSSRLHVSRSECRQLLSGVSPDMGVFILARKTNNKSFRPTGCDVRLIATPSSLRKCTIPVRRKITREREERYANVTGADARNFCTSNKVIRINRAAVAESRLSRCAFSVCFRDGRANLFGQFGQPAIPIRVPHMRMRSLIADIKFPPVLSFSFFSSFSPLHREHVSRLIRALCPVGVTRGAQMRANEICVKMRMKLASHVARSSGFIGRIQRNKFCASCTSIFAALTTIAIPVCKTEQAQVERITLARRCNWTVYLQLYHNYGAMDLSLSGNSLTQPVDLSLISCRTSGCVRTRYAEIGSGYATSHSESLCIARILTTRLIAYTGEWSNTNPSTSLIKQLYRARVIDLKRCCKFDKNRRYQMKKLNEITAEALFYGSAIGATRTSGKFERRAALVVAQRWFARWYSAMAATQLIRHAVGERARQIGAHAKADLRFVFPWLASQSHTCPHDCSCAQMPQLHGSLGEERRP
ncbi:hypothetical protein DBV15_04847 [Temnothorax longispinosus]|uniref:Uncharacterized protein n=1 Tax=Temnothorax longispinosus TaxID=300112 RepID=A0A4S2KGT0_9HYME|nr:hypothetical protein DBV15_04847 [Temnothorax longispinosus]